MLGHASWNGTLTIFEIISEDMGLSDGEFLVFQLIIVIVMIAFVWIIGTGLLHSVREAPDGREVDQYQQNGRPTVPAQRLPCTTHQSPPKDANRATLQFTGRRYATSVLL